MFLWNGFDIFFYLSLFIPADLSFCCPDLILNAVLDLFAGELRLGRVRLQ